MLIIEDLLTEVDWQDSVVNPRSVSDSGCFRCSHTSLEQGRTQRKPGVPGVRVLDHMGQSSFGLTEENCGEVPGLGRRPAEDPCPSPARFQARCVGDCSDHHRPIHDLPEAALQHLSFLCLFNAAKPEDRWAKPSKSSQPVNKNFGTLTKEFPFEGINS